MAPLPAHKKLSSKYQSLKQDYQDLAKETQCLEERLQEAKERRSRLLAEVRFLRGKHKILTSNQTQTNKKKKLSQSQKLQSPSRNDRWRKSSKEDGPTKKNHASLDLNQASEPMKQDEEAQVLREPLKLETKTKVYGMEDDPWTSGLKLSISRGLNNAIVGGGGGTERRIGKRKISWQDEIALRV